MRRLPLFIVLSSLGTGANAFATEGAPEKPLGGAGVVAELSRIEATLTASKYSHATRVDVKKGHYEFDCSGMVAWVLRRAAPKAQSAVAARNKNGRPLARDYYQRIASIKPGAPRWGWTRVPRVADAAPGDVIAWLKPKEIASSNTGHVAFVVEPPRRVPGSTEAYLLRIADASRYRHAEDSRAETGMDGFGVGTILVVADETTGGPRAYGWFGLRSGWILETAMAIGRPDR